MNRPEYDEDKNIGDDTHGCPGVMRHWCDLEDYVNHLEAERDRLGELCVREKLRCQAKLDQMREALEVYADKKNWKRDEYGHLCVFTADTNALYPAFCALKGIESGE